jgi:hypothetical protein
MRRRFRTDNPRIAMWADGVPGGRNTGSMMAGPDTCTSRLATTRNR